MSSGCRRWILFAFSFLCTSLAAGLVYGWPALRQQLQAEGSDLSEKTLGAVFTVGAWSTQGGRFFTGLARDRFGTSAIACVCLVVAALGSLGVALSDPNKAIALGTSLFAIGLGSGVQLCILPVAGLFPESTGMISSSLAGAFQISGLLFLALTSGSISRKVAFLYYSASLLLLTFFAVLLLPRGQSFVLEEQSSSQKEDSVEDCNMDTPVELSLEDLSQAGSIMENASQSVAEYPKSNHQGNSQLPEEDPLRSQESSREQDFEKEATENASQSDDEFPSNHQGGTHVREEESLRSEESSGEQELEKEATNANGAGDAHTSVSNMTPAGDRPPTAMEQIKTLEYILLCTWFSFCLVPLQYYVGSIGFQLEEKGDDGFYTDLFSITYAGATVLAPLGGYLGDRYGLGITQALATCLAATSLFILASDGISLKGQIIGLVAYGTGRMFIFGMYFSNNGKRFGYTNYGTLVGFGLLVSAIVSLLQYPLIALAAEGKAAVVNIACGATLLSLFPYFVWLHRREKSTSL